MSNTDTQLATITTTLKFIQDDIAEIKEFQKDCPIHQIEKAVNTNTNFRSTFVYILSGSGFLGILGMLGKKFLG